MKRLFVAISLFVYLAGFPLAHAEEVTEFRDLAVGRRLTYRLSWNGIPVGLVSTAVEGLTEIRGRGAYKVSLHAKTNRWASLIYNVDDEFVTYIDRKTSNSLRHEIARSEGRYRKRAVIEYIYDKFLAEYRYLKSGRSKTVGVAPEVQDPLSAVYYFLRRGLKEGDHFTLNIDLNEKSYKLYAKLEKGRKIRIPKIGRFDTLIIRPHLERKGRPYKRGSGWAYVSRTEEHLPLFVVVNVFPWGRFSAILVSTG